jgi:hypothetical protein
MSQRESKKKKIGKIELDDYHYHELLDRLHVIMSTIDDHLIQHPVCKIETNIKDHITNAVDQLVMAYHSTGGKQ